MNILRRKRLGANNNEYHAENPNFRTRPEQVEENGELAVRKCFDPNIFGKMFKRNGLFTGKSTAINPEME